MDELKADLQLVAAGKVPRQAKRHTLKQVPLSWPVVSSIIFLGGGWITIQLLTTTFTAFGESRAASAIRMPLSVVAYLLSFICALLWCTVLGQACWKKVSMVAASETELHEKWMAAALVLLTICVFPGVAWWYTATPLEYLTDVIQPKGALSQLASVFQGPSQIFYIAITVLANISIFFAFLAAFGWVFVRAAHALKLSRLRQRMIAFLYVGCLALFAMLGYRNLAWVAYSTSLSLFYTGSTDRYQPNPGLELALAMNPDLAQAYYDRGMKKAAANEPSAINDFSKVIALKPGTQLESQALQERSKLYAASGEFTKAISDLQRAITLTPHTFRNVRLTARMTLASYFRKSKQYVQALAVYSEIIAKHPIYEPAYALSSICSKTTSGRHLQTSTQL
jgi:hypothetical protein